MNLSGTSTSRGKIPFCLILHRKLLGASIGNLASMAGRRQSVASKEILCTHQSFLDDKNIQKLRVSVPFMSSLFACDDVFFPWTFMPIRFQQIMDWSVICTHPWSSLLEPPGCFLVPKGVLKVFNRHSSSKAVRVKTTAFRTRWWLNQPIWKNMLVKFDHSPSSRGGNKKYLKPPPRKPTTSRRRRRRRRCWC